MTKLDENTLVDQIYEAAVVPEQWPRLLEGFSEQIGSVAGFLLAVNAERAGCISSPEYAAAFQEFVASGFIDSNPRMARIVNRGLVGFTVADHQLLTQDEMAQNPMYAFLRKHGGGWSVGCAFDVPSGDQLILNFERAHAHGPFDTDTIAYTDQFRSHFARSALLAARLGLERARVAVETMNAIGLAAAVVGNQHRLVAWNPLFESLIPSQIQDRQERVHLVHQGTDKTFASALKRVASKEPLREALSIPVPREDDQPAFILHLVPLRGGANDIFSNAYCLLIATPVTRKQAPPIQLLQGLFDLSFAEARLARNLTEGQSLTEMAHSFGVQIGTLRNQLKSVFSKTGLSRQSDLVALLSGLSLAREEEQ